MSIPSISERKIDALLDGEVLFGMIDIKWMRFLINNGLMFGWYEVLRAWWYEVVW
jgi:hypothetical protein